MRLKTISGCLLLLSLLHSCTSTYLFLENPQDASEATLQEILTKPNLKVLDIGNSYTNGATALLPQIVRTSGVELKDMCLYKIVRGESSFKNWCDVYNDLDSKAYSFSKVIGDLVTPVDDMQGTANDGSVFRRILNDVDWDLIIIHQVSTYAPYYEQWKTKGKGGYLDDFIKILKDTQPRAQLGFLLIHSYWDYYEGNKEASSYLRWKKIANSVKHLQYDYDFCFVIPYGTAVENLRFSGYNTEYDMTSDGSHCARGLCQYTAACCYYEALLATRTGVSCLGNTYRYDSSNVQTQYPSTSITEDSALAAQTAAILALKDMFHCTMMHYEF